MIVLLSFPLGGGTRLVAGVPGRGLMLILMLSSTLKPTSVLVWYSGKYRVNESQITFTEVEP